MPRVANISRTLGAALFSLAFSVAFAARAQHSAPIPPVDITASAVAAPDAAGVVDPHRALLLRAVFARDVTRRLNVPAAVQQEYGERLQAALAQNQLGNLSGESR
jgi:hypothetical protein